MGLEDCIQIHQLSDTGLVRTHNEDSTAFDARLGLAILADGMGGYRGGEVASAVAVTCVVQHVSKNLAQIDNGGIDQDSGLRDESLLISDAVKLANDEIFTMARDNPEYQGMGTTAVSLLFYDNQVSIAHVGDSRAYRLRSGNLEQLTNDHTVRQELIDKGYYTPEEADRTVSRNLVTRAVGIDVTVEVDLCEEMVLPGDIYLLCSDGLNDMIGDEAISELLKTDDDLETIAGALVNRANNMGGLDNITVLLVRILDSFSANKRWSDRIVDWFN